MNGANNTDTPIRKGKDLFNPHMIPLTIEQNQLIRAKPPATGIFHKKSLRIVRQKHPNRPTDDQGQKNNQHYRDHFTFSGARQEFSTRNRASDQKADAKNDGPPKSHLRFLIEESDHLVNDQT